MDVAGKMADSSNRRSLRPIHPFPARMAPDLVLERLSDIENGSRVLDPMAGSGVVLRHAIELGHDAVGYDLDPLAVLMARVWTTPVSQDNLSEWLGRVVDEARATRADDVVLDWIDRNEETRSFVEYWFGEAQRSDLRRISSVLHALGEGGCAEDRASLDLVRLALSRIIVTKEPRASLARDTSHSRPHRVLERSDFRVFPALERSVEFLRGRLAERPPKGTARVGLGDARRLAELANDSVDAVITSPPYLNAIDYMRGHRLALVWLGYGLEKLRRIRACSIGAERAPDNPDPGNIQSRICGAMGTLSEIPPRRRRMIERYAGDLYRMLAEIARVLRPGGTATLIVGNSCLKGVDVDNAAGVREAATMAGLMLTGVSERTLPDNRRYLPVNTEGRLRRRMRTESVCRFEL